MSREGRPTGAAPESPAKATDFILAAALEYAKTGVPAFPCVGLGKRPLTANGFKDATTDPEALRRGGSGWPDANVGMVTGSLGYNVLDVDIRATGSGMTIFYDLKQRGLLRGLIGLART